MAKPKETTKSLINFKIYVHFLTSSTNREWLLIWCLNTTCTPNLVQESTKLISTHVEMHTQNNVLLSVFLEWLSYGKACSQSPWNRDRDPDPDPDLRSDWAAVDRSFSGSKTQIWSEPPKICVSQPWKRDEQGFSFQIVVTRDFWLGSARARIVGPMKFESGSGSGSDFLFSFRTDLDLGLGLGLSFKGIGNTPYRFFEN